MAVGTDQTCMHRRHLHVSYLVATMVVGAAVAAAAILPGAATAASVNQRCSIATTRNDFSLVVTGRDATRFCRTTARRWNTSSPSDWADGFWISKGGVYRQLHTDQVCRLRHGRLAATAWDSGFQMIGDDVYRSLIRNGWLLVWSS